MKLFYTEDYERLKFDGRQYWSDKEYIREYYLLGMLLHRRVKLEPWE